MSASEIKAFGLKTYMVVTKSIVIPSTDSVDEAGGIDVADNLLEFSLDSALRLAPALIVDDLSYSISVWRQSGRTVELRTQDTIDG